MRCPWINTSIPLVIVLDAESPYRGAQHLTVSRSTEGWGMSTSKSTRRRMRNKRLQPIITDPIQTTMKATRSILVSAWLFPACVLTGFAQTAGKPAIIPSAAPAATPVPAATSGGPVDSNTYVIGPDDQLQVTVWQNPQLSGSFVVRPDGKISLPLINDIQASGFTPTQLSDDITSKLKKFVNDPTVGVTVLAVRSKNIYLMGEVMHVGPIPIAPGMTVLQAIATAGGLSPYANAKKIYILRGDPAHQTQIHFDYNKAKKGNMQGIALQPGDTIFVP